MKLDQAEVNLIWAARDPPSWSSEAFLVSHVTLKLTSVGHTEVPGQAIPVFSIREITWFGTEMFRVKSRVSPEALARNKSSSVRQADEPSQLVASVSSDARDSRGLTAAGLCRHPLLLLPFYLHPYPFLRRPPTMLPTLANPLHPPCISTNSFSLLLAGCRVLPILIRQPPLPTDPWSTYTRRVRNGSCRAKAAPHTCRLRRTYVHVRKHALTLSHFWEYTKFYFEYFLPSAYDIK